MASVDRKTGKGIVAGNRLVQGEAATTIPNIANTLLSVAFTNITNAHANARHLNMT